MSKKIPIDQLKPGMYVADLGAEWMDHPFLRSSFAVKDEATVRKIAEAGIRELYIDPERGLDVPNAPTREEVHKKLDAEIIRIAEGAPPVRRVTAREEIGRAKKVQAEANLIVHNIMHDVRMGKQVDMEQVNPVVENMTESILRNGSALLSLCRVKNKDEYTFLHSVSVCALLVAFCRSAGMDAKTIHLAGVGGLLHDIGKVKVPDAILNKPGPLTEEEFEKMRAHPVESKRVLDATGGISEISIQVAFEHHERYDGSGYPGKLGGGQISQMGQMAAICDVYDAITSNRCYHKGLAAHEALRKIFEWSKFHFNPALAQQFIRTIGIYPVGTLVMLESGRIGVVVEQPEGSLLQPVVRAIFDTQRNCMIAPVDIDLSKPIGHGGGDRIVGHETPEKWGIDPGKYL